MFIWRWGTPVGDALNWNEHKSSLIKWRILRGGQNCSTRGKRQYPGKTAIPGENCNIPGKTFSEQRWEATNWTHIWRQVWEWNPGHIGERRVFSTQHLHCPPIWKEEQFDDKQLTQIGRTDPLHLQIGESGDVFLGGKTRHQCRVL